MTDELLDDSPESKNDSAPVINDERAEYPFATIGKDDLAVKIKKFLEKDGYKIESGIAVNAVYGKGSKTMRILFGAFVKRFTWGVKVTGDDNQSTLIFTKDEKGYWGGAIGISQVKKEWSRIIASLSAYHTKHSS